MLPKTLGTPGEFLRKNFDSLGIFMPGKFSFLLEKIWNSKKILMLQKDL
jgi:hypothetical protein